MAIVISDELQELFNLKEHIAGSSKKLNLAETELRNKVKENSGKDVLEVHDLDISHKLIRIISEVKHEVDMTNQQLENKKIFFLNLLESSGCPKLTYSNKEWQDDGSFKYIPYILSINENNDGETELLIEAKEPVNERFL